MKLLDKARTLLYDKHGPLTRQLLQEPGRFGLGKLPSQQKPDRTTTSVCGYCSTGCGLNIHLKDGRAVGLTPATGHPVNLGMACPKGWEALTPLTAPDRATVPLLRDKAGLLQPVDWHEALTVFCERFKAIQGKYGNESVAFLSTGQIVTEEMALLGVLAKFGMNILHGDANTRQCMATAATAYKQSFGFDAPPFTYRDFEESDVLVFVGANPCIAHPIMWERVCRNPHEPEIVVVDPRRTETAMAATQHLALQPKSDLTLLYGIANLLIENGWIDQKYIDRHTRDFAAFREHVAGFDLDRVSQTTGLTEEEILTFAQIIHEGKRVSFWWTMGVNQSHEGVRVAQAIINLALMTGNIGRPGTGANSITGQCNAMGSRLFSNTTNLLGGHDFTNPDHRRKIASVLNIDEDRIPIQNSLPYHQILEQIDTGKIKGLWFIGTNPGHSWIHQNEFVDRMKKLEFIVVQDMYHTAEIAQLADLVLPAAGWGEKEGHLINSERRISLVKKVSPAPGQALADFHIFKLIAEYWGCSDMLADWESPEAVFQILKQCSVGQPCDITGITDYQALDEAGGIQWPLSEGQTLHDNERRLFEDGRYFHADGKARFCFEDPQPVAEETDIEYPLMLLTGRGSSAQWHTQTRTAKSAILRKLYPADAYVEINPLDAEQLAIPNNTWVSLTSRRGHMQARSYVTPNVSPGQVFVPMHYDATNQLTFPSFDPYSYQPSYKYCAVKAEPFIQE